MTLGYTATVGTSQQTFPLGATIQFSSTFSPSNPPNAVVIVSFFQNGVLLTGGTGNIPMTFQSGTTWTAQWDSGLADGGPVQWEVHSTPPSPIAAGIGNFFLASNNSTVAGL